MDTQNKSTLAAAPPQYSSPPAQNPQFNPQYNPQFSPQYNPQFNPQFSPGTAYPPQVIHQTAPPNPNVVLVQVPGGSNPGGICAEHGHIPVTTHGALGIFLAIFCFPLGLIALFMDRRTTCNRCGALLSGGL